MNKKIYVPIGSSCSIAAYLRAVHCRKEAFPFDWTVTPLKSAINLINNGFEDFLLKENLIFLEPTKRLLFEENGINVTVTNDIITPVYDKKNHILFVHDFSKNGIADYDRVKAKYDKRIKRLKNLIADKDKDITFIYENALPNDWQMQQYQKVNFKYDKISEDELCLLNNSLDDEFKLVSLSCFKKRRILSTLFWRLKNKFV